MSRAARNRKALRSGAIGFVAGLATLGVVAHGSPAQHLIRETTSSVRALAGADAHPREPRASQRDRQVAPQAEEQWVLPAQPEEQWAQPQQQPYVQPAPSQQPQSQAS